jgi:hypothetical protein
MTQIVYDPAGPAAVPLMAGWHGSCAAVSTSTESLDAMPNAHRLSLPRRLRAAGPHGQGAASSLLRLSQHAVSRLPSGIELAGWMNRAASVLDVQQGEPIFAQNALGAESTPIITRLLPSHELAPHQ